MKQMWKKSDPEHQGESWYSHKTQDGSWCNGKEKKEAGVNTALLSTAVAQLQASNARIEARLKEITEMILSIGGRLPVEPKKNDGPLPF